MGTLPVFLFKFIVIAALLSVWVGIGAILVDSAHLKALSTCQKTYQKPRFWIGVLMQSMAVLSLFVWLAS